MKLGQIYKFYAEIKQEAKKIVYPSRQELISSFLVVIAVVIIFSLCCLFVDYIIHYVITLLLNVGK